MPAHVTGSVARRGGLAAVAAPRPIRPSVGLPRRPSRTQSSSRATRGFAPTTCSLRG